MMSDVVRTIVWRNPKTGREDTIRQAKVFGVWMRITENEHKQKIYEPGSRAKKQSTRLFRDGTRIIPESDVRFSVNLPGF